MGLLINWQISIFFLQEIQDQIALFYYSLTLQPYSAKLYNTLGAVFGDFIHATQYLSDSICD